MKVSSKSLDLKIESPINSLNKSFIFLNFLDNPQLFIFRAHNAAFSLDFRDFSIDPFMI